MDGQQGFEIRLAPEAEEAFGALPLSERLHLKSVVEGLAEVTALSPPHFPAWFRRWGLGPPVLRLQVAGLRLSYELDLEDRSLRICALEVREEPLTAPVRNDARVSFV